MRADAEVKASIHVDVLVNDTWVEAGFVVPRVLWAHEILDLGGLLAELPASGIMSIRLRWTAVHKLDFIGLDTGPAHKFSVQELPLVSASHSTLGNVLSMLAYSDDVYCELAPGESIQLFFRPIHSYGARVEHVLIIEGRYYSLS